MVKVNCPTGAVLVGRMANSRQGKADAGLLEGRAQGHQSLVPVMMSMVWWSELRRRVRRASLQLSGIYQRPQQDRN